MSTHRRVTESSRLQKLIWLFYGLSTRCGLFKAENIFDCKNIFFFFVSGYCINNILSITTISSESRPTI